MRPPRAGKPVRLFLIASAALLGLAAGSPAAARGGYHHEETPPPPPCGFVGGTLADPAETARCLAERYKAGRARRGAQPPPAPTNAPPPSARWAPSCRGGLPR